MNALTDFKTDAMSREAAVAEAWFWRREFREQRDRCDDNPRSDMGQELNFRDAEWARDHAEELYHKYWAAALNARREP